jgi:sugar phosphate permease
MKRLHPAWTVAAATFAVLMIGAGIRATPGVLIVPLERDLGWSRATISGAISLNLLLYGLAGPFCAALAQRFGIRRIIVFALLLLAATCALATRITAAWQLMLLWGLCVGAGTGLIANVLGAVVVNRWFSQRRGVVLGVLTAATATGQLIFLPILARLAEGSGWRSALLVMSGAAVLIVPLALFFVRESPAELGLLPYGADAGEVVVPSAPGNPAANAIRTLFSAARTRDFWLLAGTFFVCGASTNGLIGTHLIPACVDHGIPEVRAAGMLALMGIFDLFGTTGSGWLSDRFDGRKLLFTYYGLRGLSLLFLPHALIEQSGLSIFTVFYGLDWIATVPPTVRLATDAFGRRDGPVVYGWVMASHQVGAGAAALGAGLIRTIVGDYSSAFLASGTMCLVAAVLALGIGRTRTVLGHRPTSPSPGDDVFASPKAATDLSA